MKFYFILSLSAFAMAGDRNLEKTLQAASSRFTGLFFSEVMQATPGKSVIVSAYSVMAPLALLGLASEGQSHDEILNAIGLPNDNVMKSVFSFADRKLRSIKDVELKIANKVYIPLNYELSSKFVAWIRKYFNFEVTNIDIFKNVETAKEINDWVENKTNRRIKDLIDPDSIDENTRAILVNALYFKGTWMTRFKKSETRYTDFYITKDKRVKVYMMNNKSDYKYTNSERLQSKILIMPYVGEQTSLTIILPNEIDGIADLLKKVKDISIIDQVTKNMYEVQVDVSIPRFKIETTTDLKEILKKINVTSLFSPREAQLKKLLKADKDLYVSSATQKALIEVNEEGAEAAAANHFGVTHFISPSISFAEHRFNADHPFLFLLKEANNILFSGIYYA